MEESTSTQQSVAPMKRFNSALMNVKTQEYLDVVLGARKETFVNNLVAVVANNKDLQACEPMSIVYAALKATALDLPLDPNLGYAYLIPYKDNRNGITLAQLQFGYKAFIQLGQRTGRIALMNATDVREGEFKGRNLLTGEIFLEEVPDRESKKIVGYAAYFSLTNGFSKTEYMTAENVEKHAKRYSQTYRSQYEKIRASSKWSTDFEDMARKTVLKRLLSKWAPLSVKDSGLNTALQQDQMVFREDGNGEYLDNPNREAPDDQEQPDESREAIEGAVAEMKGRLREKQEGEQGALKLDNMP